MGQKISIPTPKPFQNSASARRSFCQSGMFTTLMRRPVNKRGDVTALISSCISTASARAQEYLAFKDPEGRFQPSPRLLTQVFLMTCISQSVRVEVTDAFTCTAMTPEQRVLLGADWVWAVLEQPTKSPKSQIAVRVLHLPECGGAEEAEARSESVRMAQMVSRDKNVCERMVDFCSSIGKDCYALFLFFGREDDRRNIYGVLSNNFEAAIGKCDQIDRALIENFFKGLRCFSTPRGMMQAIASREMGEPLTLMIKFS